MWRSWEKLRFPHPLVRWLSSQPSSNSKVVLVAPLTPQRGLTPPSNLYASQYSVRLVSNFDIPDVNKNSTIRRAEYSRRTDAVRHSLDVRHNRSHQQSLYEFALVTCLGVNSNASSSSLLLDLACGAFLPFGGYSLTAKLPFKLGLDQLWVTANGDPGVISLFAQECVRVLASRGGAAVFQFYPGNKGDLDAICEALADAHHCVHGCRLSARPVENRGIKIFVYCYNCCSPSCSTVTGLMRGSFA